MTGVLTGSAANGFDAIELDRRYDFFLCLLAFCRLRYLCFDIFLRRFLIREPNSNLRYGVANEWPRGVPDGHGAHRFANRDGNRKPDCS